MQWVKEPVLGGIKTLKMDGNHVSWKVGLAPMFLPFMADYRGLVYTHTVPQGQTINGEYYILVLEKLIKDDIPKKRPDLVRRWKLHHDNVRPHVANTVL